MLTSRIVVFFIIGGCIKLLFLYKEFIQKIPATNEVPVENIETTIAVEDYEKAIEIESMSFWELHWMSLTEGERNFWQMFAISSIFLVLNALVMLQLLRRFLNRKEEREQEKKDLEIIIERCERFVQGMRVSMELMKEEQEKRWTEFRNEIEEVKRKKGNVEILFTEFQNLMDVVKQKMREENSGTLQNFTDRMENNMRAKNERLAELAKVMKEIGLNVGRCLMPKVELAVSPTHTESPVEMTTNSISYIEARKVVATEKRRQKRNLRISKIPIRVDQSVYSTLGRLTEYVAAQSKLGPSWSSVNDRMEHMDTTMRQEVLEELVQGVTESYTNDFLVDM
jgi:hypothetical protein